MVEGNFEPSDEDVIKAYEVFKQILVSTEKMRQRAMYVNVNLDKNQVETPLMIGEKEVKNILWVVEICLKIVKHNVEKSSEKNKKKLKRAFSSISREEWETGEISINWLRRDK